MNYRPNPIPEILRFLLLTFALVSPFLLSAQSESAKALLRELESANGEKRIRLLGDLCYELSTGPYEISHPYCREGVELARRSGNDTLLAQALNDYGINAQQHGKYSEALLNYEESLQLRLKLKLLRQVAATYQKIGVIHLEQGHLQKAQSAAMESLRYFEEVKDSAAIAVCLNTLGMISRSSLQYADARRYYRRSAEIHQQRGDEEQVANTMGNLAHLFDLEGQYDSAVAYYSDCAKAFQKSGNLINLAAVQNNLGTIYRKRGEKDRALQAFTLASGAARKVDDENGLALYLLNRGSILTAKGNLEDAESTLQEGLKLATKYTARPLMRLSYKNLSELKQKQGKAEEALHYLREYVSINDSIISRESLKSLTEMRVKYESEKQEQEIKLLNQDREISKLKLSEKDLLISQRNNQLLLMGVATLLLFSGGGILYFWYNRKQERIRAVEKLEEQKARLKAVIEAQDAERTRISKDLHDGIGQMLSAARINFNHFETEISGVASDKLVLYRHSQNVLAEACQELSSISRQMMPKSLKEGGLIHALEDMLEKSLGKTQLRYEFSHRGFESARLAENLEITLYRITQELLGNSLKHSGATQLHIHLMKTSGNIILSLEDNGCGFKPGRGPGMGLSNITARAEMFKGKFHIESGPGGGTVATVRIPL